MKADDGIEHSLTEPIHRYLRSLNDDKGDALHCFSIVPSTFNQDIKSYWSKFIVDRPSWWKSFFQNMVDLKILIQVNPLYWIVSGFALLLFYEKNLQILQMNGITICFCQTEITRHVVDLTLCSFYPIFMERQTIWSVLTMQKPNTVQHCTLWLLWWVWWVYRDTDEWIIICKSHMMYQVLLACTYSFFPKSRNQVRLP